MPKFVEFEGQTLTFPDDASNDEIVGILGGLNTPVKSDEKASSQEDEDAIFATQEQQVQPQEGQGGPTVRVGDKVPAKPAQFDEQVKVDQPLQPVQRASQFPQVALNTDELDYASKIKQIETGGLDNKYARTSVKPKGTQAGSSAYGPVQITKGLLVGYLTNKAKLFSPEEKTAMAELMDRQKVSLIIGGRDRKDYAKGGIHEAYGEFMAQSFGFTDVEKFLDAFDYGGDLGLSMDANFKLQYENFSRKMLKDTLKAAGGDALEAASVWHGGMKWRTAGSRKDTNIYRDKFSNL